ncbi:MAG: PilZ domain-containing protein [Nitrospira sp.]|nr:PilZ domain-containing protein [Candidatus Manganitrophaceae bacterium]HIL35331.1 PilZ domain-containing protein [Candidatus Manganitrophaceae bacterium]
MDKRQHYRVPFTGKAKVSTETRSVEVTISNMSLGGLLLHAKKRFDLGKELTVKISGTHRGKSFREIVLGKIVVTHLSPDGNAYGLQFLDYIDQEQQPSLYSWVSSRQKKAISSFLREPLP